MVGHRLPWHPFQVQITLQIQDKLPDSDMFPLQISQNLRIFLSNGSKTILTKSIQHKKTSSKNILELIDIPACNILDKTLCFTLLHHFKPYQLLTSILHDMDTLLPRFIFLLHNLFRKQKNQLFIP